jgi:hypothetical protein
LKVEIEADRKKIAELPGLTKKSKRKLQQPWLNQTSSRQRSSFCPTLKKLIRNYWRISAKWYQMLLVSLQSIWTFDCAKQLVTEWLIVLVILFTTNFTFHFLSHLVYNFRRSIRQL